MRKYSRELLIAAKDLRKNQTEAEAVLWQYLRNRNLANLKFRRQVPFDRFILDFLCPCKKVIIEVDGKYHLKQKEKDLERDLYFENKGYRVLRIKNEEIFEDIDLVLNKIKSFVKEK